MNIREFSKPVTSAKLNESLARKFGTRIDVAKFTTEQLQDARNKLRTKLSQIQTTESFNAVQNEEYQKNKLFLDVLNAAIDERKLGESRQRTVNEGAEDTAEIVMAAKDMVDRVTGWMEDTAEMETESMLELADAIRDEMGSEKSEQFTNSVRPALEALYSAMEQTRTALTTGVGMLTGEQEPVDTIGADDEMEPVDDLDVDVDADAADLDVDIDDEFGAADAATGGEELGGRERRESVDRSKKKSLKA